MCEHVIDLCGCREENGRHVTVPRRPEAASEPKRRRRQQLSCYRPKQQHNCHRGGECQTNGGERRDGGGVDGGVMGMCRRGRQHVQPTDKQCSFGGRWTRGCCLPGQRQCRTLHDVHEGVKAGSVSLEQFEQLDGESLVWPEDDNRSTSDLFSRRGWHVGGMSNIEGALLTVCPGCGSAQPCPSFPVIDDVEFEMDATEWLHYVRARTPTSAGSAPGSFTQPYGRMLQKLDTDSLSQDVDHSCAERNRLSPVSGCSMMAAEVSLKDLAAKETLEHTTTNPFARFALRVERSLHRKSLNAPTSPTNSVMSELTIDEELKPTFSNIVGTIMWNYLNQDSKTPETIATPEYKVTVLQEKGEGKLGAIRVERVNVPLKAKGAKSLPRRIRKGLIRATKGMFIAARAVRNTASGIYHSIPRIQLRKPRFDPEEAAAAHQRIMERHYKMYGRPQGGEDYKVDDCMFGDDAYEHGAFWS